MAIALTKRVRLSEGADSPITVSAVPWLDSIDCTGNTRERLQSIVSVAEVGSSDLTLDREQVNAVEKVINGVCVPAYESYTFWCTGQLASRGEYLVRVTFTTDAARVEVSDIWIDVA